MPLARSAVTHPPGTDALPAARLISVTGTVAAATPRDVEERLAAGGFFWLDLESLDHERLEHFGRSMRLDPSATTRPEDTCQPSGLATAGTGAISRRPSPAVVGDTIQELIPTAVGSALGAGAGADLLCEVMRAGAAGVDRRRGALWSGPHRAARLLRAAAHVGAPGAARRSSERERALRGAPIGLARAAPSDGARPTNAR